MYVCMYVCMYLRYCRLHTTQYQFSIEIIGCQTYASQTSMLSLNWKHFEIILIIFNVTSYLWYYQNNTRP